MDNNIVDFDNPVVILVSQIRRPSAPRRNTF